MVFMIPELANTSSGVVEFWLSESQRFVVLDGFDVSDPNFDLLQRYMCGHLLCVNNVIRGTITSESVAGSISASYQVKGDDNYENLWWKRYVALKTQLKCLSGSRVV